MGEMREKDQADWDLERCFELFDEALVSRDERVVNALRNLLMIVTLTAPETELTSIGRRTGPLRRIMEDHNNLARRVNAMEDVLQELKHASMLNNGIKQPNWPYFGGPGGGGSTAQGGVTAIGTYLHEQEVHVQNKIRGLLDDEC